MKKRAIILFGSVLLCFFILTIFSTKATHAEIYMSISGTVKDAASGKGIGGVEVIASGVMNKQIFSAKTDSTGNYYLKIVPEGEYVLYLQPPSGYIFKPYTKSIKVEKGKNVVGANFELPLGGAVSGVIYKSDGITPLINAPLFALTNKGVSMTSTDSSGKYILSGLEPETSTKLRLIAYGYGMAEKDGVNVTVGKVTPNINISLPASTSGVKGMVSTYDSVGVPITDAFVVIKGSNGFGITITDSNGNYELNGLPEGIYEATIFKIGFARKQVGNIIISKEQFTGQNFTLTEQPLPQITSLTETDRMNIVTLDFPIDNSEYPYVGLQFVSSGSCWCGSFNFTGAVGIGFSIGKGLCRCTNPCGRIECTSWKNINVACLCFGLGISSGLNFYECGDLWYGYSGSEGLMIDFPLPAKWRPLSIGWSTDCGSSAGVGAGAGIYWCSCALYVPE